MDNKFKQCGTGSALQVAEQRTETSVDLEATERNFIASSHFSHSNKNRVSINEEDIV
jgi:hypothetical protein